MTRYIYICIILTADLYLRGINDVIDLINSIFPSNTLVIEKYISNGLPQQTTLALDDFFNKYPSGDRIIISGFTSFLIQINNYLKINDLNIISLSISASSTIIKQLKNTLTYGYYNQYEVMSFYMVFRDYQMRNVKILLQDNSLNKIFFKDIVELMKFQGQLLGIDVEVDTLELNKKYNYKKRTSILLLADPESISFYVNDNFLNQIPSDCFISLTDINGSTKDIFKNVPTIVYVPVPLNYTSTTQLVYDNVKNKDDFYYVSYCLFDILYVLEFISNTIIPLTLENYIKINPFTNIPAAWTNSSSFILNISGSEFGTFDCVFTKNVLVEKNLLLFNLVNNGGTATLPDSKSICKTVGIVPFFLTNTYYCEQNYHKIYDGFCNLVAVRFDKNNTKYLNNYHNNNDNNGIVYNIAEDVQNKFLIKYDKNGFFLVLEKIFNFNESCLPKINSTLDKKIIKSYIK